MHIAVALLRVSEGLDFSAVMEDVEEHRRTILPTIRGNQSFSQLSQGDIFHFDNHFIDSRTIFLSYRGSFVIFVLTLFVLF